MEGRGEQKENKREEGIFGTHVPSMVTRPLHMIIIGRGGQKLLAWEEEEGEEH